MRSIEIDKLATNQILIWRGDAIIIVGEKKSNGTFYTGNCIIISHKYRNSYNFFKNKNEPWSNYKMRLLPKLPSILNFEIYNNEKY